MEMLGSAQIWVSAPTTFAFCGKLSLCLAGERELFRCKDFWITPSQRQCFEWLPQRHYWCLWNQIQWTAYRCGLISTELQTEQPAELEGSHWAFFSKGLYCITQANTTDLLLLTVWHFPCLFCPLFMLISRGLFLNSFNRHSLGSFLIRYHAEYFKCFIISFNSHNTLVRQALSSFSIFTNQKMKLRWLCTMQIPFSKRVTSLPSSPGVSWPQQGPWKCQLFSTGRLYSGNIKNKDFGNI